MQIQLLFKFQPYNYIILNPIYSKYINTQQNFFLKSYSVILPAKTFSHRSKVDLKTCSKLKNSRINSKISLSHAPRANFFWKKQEPEKSEFSIPEEIKSLLKRPGHENVKLIDSFLSSKLNKQQIANLKAACYIYEGNQDKAIQISEENPSNNEESQWLYFTSLLAKGDLAKAKIFFKENMSNAIEDSPFLQKLIDASHGYKEYLNAYESWSETDINYRKDNYRYHYENKLQKYHLKLDSKATPSQEMSRKGINSVLLFDDLNVVIPTILCQFYLDNLKFDYFSVIQEIKNLKLNYELVKFFNALGHSRVVEKILTLSCELMLAQKNLKDLDVIFSLLRVYPTIGLETEASKWVDKISSDILIKEIISSPEILKKFANIHFSLKNFDKAGDLLEKVIALEPLKVENYDKLIMQAKLSDQKDKVKNIYDLAIKNFQDAINSSPSPSIPLLSQLGSIYRKAELKEKAIETYSKITQVDATYKDAYEELIYLLRPDPKKMIEVMKQYTKIDPRVSTKLGDYLFFTENNFDEAILLYKKRLEFDPKHIRSDYMIYLSILEKSKNEANEYYDHLKKKYGESLKKAEDRIYMNQMMHERTYYPLEQAIQDSFGE